MSSIKVISNSVSQTKKLGSYLGKLAKKGDIFLLSGNLGSGKTCLTQGIAHGLKVNAKVISPSFVIVREYKGRIPMYHIDLYRLNNIEEILNLGLEQYFENDGLCVVEWAEKGLSIFPECKLIIDIGYISGTKRLFDIKPYGKRYLALTKQLQKELEGWN